MADACPGQMVGTLDELIARVVGADGFDASRWCDG